MHLDYTPEQKRLRRELRAYFAALMTPERKAALGARAMEGGQVYRETIRQMGRDGWLGVGWPKEYGGGGLTPVEQLVFYEEQRRAGAPLPFVTLSTIGPAIMEHGSEEHRAEFLPKILAGEVHFAVGYSEPDAGTDLAALSTRAEIDGDHFVVNGSKMFTSGANDADYVWLAARTDPEAPRHRGISILIVPTDDPGFRHAMIHTVGGGATTMTYYEDVRVPLANCVGGLHNGWKLITAQLNHERVGLAAFSSVAVKRLEDVVDWAGATPAPEGGFVIDRPWVQANLAEAHAQVEAMKLLNWRMAWSLEQGRLNPADASAVKVYGTESVLEVYRLLQEVVGPSAIVKAGSPAAVLEGALEQDALSAQINTFGGGVNEIQREIVAMAGLGMPRIPR